MTEARPSDPILAPEMPPVVLEGLELTPEPVASGRTDIARILREPDAMRLGRLAHSPSQISWPGWRAVLRRTLLEMFTDRVNLVAAGCAFYATLALFPAISMLISLYGLMFDPVTVLPQLTVLGDLLPPSAYQLIAERVQMLVSKPPGTLGLGLLFSTAVTLWSATSATKSLITALNLAYEERESRTFLNYQATSIAITCCLIVGTVMGLGLLVALPATLHALGFDAHQRVLARLGSFGLLVLAVLVALSLLYRYGPSRSTPRWAWVTPGSALATLLWVAASALFSWYVATFATYDATYGPLGTVVAVMMWFYVTSYAVLLGAELNAELELQTARDSTDGPPRPLGRRGAYVADHVAETAPR